MRATLIPDQLTPLEAADVARSFHAAFVRSFGHDPSTRSLAILMAQSALESGRWKSLHCYNFANIKASEAYEGNYCLYRCNEIINGKVEWFDPPHAQCRFRAFENADDAAYDYLVFLLRPRFKPSWDKVIEGDPIGFVAALKAGGFFTAAEEPYRRAVVSLMSEYASKIPRWLDPAEPDPQPGNLLIDLDAQVHAEATAAAEQARFTLQEELRHSALSEMSDSYPPASNA
jgi:mannosyl-glycoprotein endo-beta-N-acetylglucosaminidase